MIANNKETKTVRFADKNLLKLINNVAHQVGYNRTLDKDFIERLPSDVNFPVVFTMIHEHIAGKPAEPHMRCMFVHNELGDRFIIDMPMYCFDVLPSVDVEKSESSESGKDSANN